MGSGKDPAAMPSRMTRSSRMHQPLSASQELPSPNTRAGRLGVVDKPLSNTPQQIKNRRPNQNRTLLSRHQPRQPSLPSSGSSSQTMDGHWRSRLTQESYLGKLGLVTNSNASRLKFQARCSGEVDPDCQIVAVEGPIFGQPFNSPRSMRSLMSQRSRDSADAARRRMSFDAENSEEDSLDEGPTRMTSLLTICFSSPLGQRLKRHAERDPGVCPVTVLDAELYCQVRHADMVNKLRHRFFESTPIISKRKKGFVTGYCHTFKFNHCERREFMKTLRTGLDWRSRKLLSLTKPCRLQLKRVSKEVIDNWTCKKRTIVNQEIAIDDDISITQVDVPEALFIAMQKMPVPNDQRLSSSLAEEEAAYLDSLHPASGPAQASGQTAVYFSRYQKAGERSASHTAQSQPQRSDKPTFLVSYKQKVWKETSQETRKMEFVPITSQDPDHLKHPGSSSMSLTIRGNSIISSSSKPSSTGIQRSLPKHLRPCPYSRRLERLSQGEGGNTSAEFGPHAEVAQKDPAADCALSPPASLSLSPWMVDSVVPSANPLASIPQTGYTTQSPSVVPTSANVSSRLCTLSTTSAVTSFGLASNSSGLTSSAIRLGAAGLVPNSSRLVTSTSGVLSTRLEAMGSGAGTVSAPVGTMPTTTMTRALVSHELTDRTDSPSEIERLSIFNLTPRKPAASGRCVVSGSEGESSPPQLSISQVFSASDLCDKELAAALGLTEDPTPVSTSAQPAPASRPNFLQSAPPAEAPNKWFQQNTPRPVPSLNVSGLQQHIRAVPQHNGLMNNSSRVQYSQAAFPVRQAAPHNHQPSILQRQRKSGPLPGPVTRVRDPPHTGKSVTGFGMLQPSPVRQHSRSERATSLAPQDDDILEVICID